MFFDLKNIDQSSQFIDKQFFLPLYTNLHHFSQKNNSLSLTAPLVGSADGMITLIQGVSSVFEAVLKGGCNLVSGTFILDPKSVLLGSVQILLGGGIIGLSTLPLTAWKTLKITLGMIVNPQETTENQKIYYENKVQEVKLSSCSEEAQKTLSINAKSKTPDFLTGKTAFFNEPDYKSQLEKDCSSDKALPKTTYNYETESKTIRVAKAILSWIFFPITFFHWLGGKILLVSSWYSQKQATDWRSTSINWRSSNPKVDVDWKYKRTSIAVNGSPVDAMILSRKSTSDNGKWILGSTGNGGLYEWEKASGASSDLQRLAIHLDANILVFNYPGVAASEGSSSYAGIGNAYKGLLHYLEDKEKGIGANTIIGYGLSLGGGVQAQGFDSHDLKPDITYLLIKDRTFATLAKAASGITRPLGFLTHLLGWNINTLDGSKKLQTSEIILQTANVQRAREIKDSEDLAKTDKLITKEASLAFGILEDQEKDSLLKNKTILGIPEMHNAARLSNETLNVLVTKIKEALNRQKLLNQEAA